MLNLNFNSSLLTNPGLKHLLNYTIFNQSVRFSQYLTNVKNHNHNEGWCHFVCAVILLLSRRGDIPLF